MSTTFLSAPVISFPLLGENFTLNPSKYFTLFGLEIHWYGVIIALGFVLAVWYAMHRRKDFGLTDDNIIDMLICAIPAGIVCARLYYVIFNPSNYFGSGKWLNIFKIWEGGLAIYGGIIGAFIAVLIFCHVKKLPLGPFLDIGGLGLLIGQAVGRWGNFINREAFGAETTVPWRMGLTDVSGSVPETIYVHPTFLYESLWNVIGFIILHFYSKKHRKYDGELFLMYIAWYGLGRYFVEGLRTDSLYLFSDIRVSQLLALISFCIAIVILIRNRLRKKHDPADMFYNRVKVSKISDVTENN
jgi:phosphatidylglycerol:prolipoprotein diacylglycerol transferase